MINTEITANCLRVLLRPIITFCIKRSAGIQLFQEIAKEIFVLVALEELSDSSANTSRLSMMTGINRREIERIRKGENNIDDLSSLKIKIIGQWQNDRKFLTRKGLPKKLLLESGQGSFVDLVSTISKELNPYTVLKEFERLRIVERIGSHIQLIQGEYISDENIEDACGIVAADFSDILAAAQKNVEKKSEIPDLHLSTRYDNICPEYIDDIKQWLVDKGAEFHRKARDYISRYDKDLNPNLWKEQGGGRVTLGTFGYSVIDKE